MAASRFSPIRSQTFGPATFHFVSGITAGDDAPYDIEAQTKIVFARIQNLLAEKGASLNDVMKITVFLTDIREYDQYNAVRNAIFADIEPPPASTGVQGLLGSPGKRVEVDAIAVTAAAA